jgi:single-stranded DNA-binding protein
MSLHVLATGILVADPQRREGRQGPFATAAVRTRGEGDDAIIVSAIAFGETAERLLKLAKGDAVAVSGRARLTSWPGRDGAEKHGISVVADQLATVGPHPGSAPRAQHRSTGFRKPYQARQTAGQRATSARALPDDRVDDLWDGAAP